MSGRVAFRRATAEDISAVIARTGGPMADNPALVPTVIAWVGEIDTEAGSQVVGIGGFAIIRGHYRAFADILPEGRRFKKDIVRAGRLAMAEARRLRIRHVYAEPEDGVPGAARWLKSLGFHPDERSAGTLYRWHS